MNEKQSYAKMLEIPVSTTNVTYKVSKKKKRKATLEKVKEALMSKINGEEKQLELTKPQKDGIVETEENIDLVSNETCQSHTETESIDAVTQNNDEQNFTEKPESFDVNITTVKKKKFKLDIISVQVAVIFVLIGIIALSSYFIKDSGINVFLSHVFGNQQSEEVKDYADFSPELFTSTNVTLNDGVMTVSEKGSVYSLCDGVVKSIEVDNNGKYLITVEHSKSFLSSVSGLDYAYCEVGAKVYKKVPLGYSNGESVSMCFFSDGELFKDFIIDGNNVVWQV